MTNRRAHEVLKEMLSDEDENLASNSISIFGRIGMASVSPDLASIDGDFTADQLEAIAAWMRDPKGVAEGVDADERRNARSSKRISLAGDYVQREDGSIYQSTEEKLLPIGEFVMDCESWKTVKMS